MNFTKSAHFFALSLAFIQGAFAGDIQVGIAKVDITPEMGVSMEGTISQNSPSKDVHDRLHVRCLVFKDGAKTLTIAIVDNTMISTSIIDRAKAEIKKQTGIPGSQVIIAATHSHSTPRGVVGLVDSESHRNYLGFLGKKIVEAVVKAEKAVVPSKIGWDSFQAPEHVFNRRWFVDDASQKKPNQFGITGEKVKMNPGRKGLVKPAGPVDPELFLLSVRTSENKPRAVLGNYGLHYVGGTGGGVISADYFGTFSQMIGEKLGVTGADNAFLGIMSNGTSGDVNNADYRKPPIKKAAYEKITAVATDLANRAAPVIKKIQHVSELKLNAVEGVIQLRVRKPDQARLKWALKNQAPDNTKLRLNRTQVYAREALALSKYPDVVDVRIQAFRLGDLAIVSIPNEVFAETGLAIKKESPFPGNTFTIELANGYHGYLPSAKQHEWGGYETWPARSAYLETTAEEKIKNEALRLLSELKNRK